MPFITDHPTFIYVIQAHETDRVKIGFSKNPTFRVVELQTGSPFLLSLYRQWPGTIELEQQIHREFESLRQIGEWFSLPSGGFDELVKRIEKVIAEYNRPERQEFRQAQADYGHMKEWAFEIFVRLRPKTKFIRDFQPRTSEEHKLKRRGELKSNEIKIALLVGLKDEVLKVESELDKVIEKLGCLSQLTESAKPQAFICAGCGTEITINNDDPQKRQFIWTEQKTGKKNPYCYECDGILIQDVDLPNAKKKMEVQS